MGLSKVLAMVIFIQ